MKNKTKCFGIDCPIKEFCERYTPENEPNSIYFHLSPWDGKRCDMFYGEGKMSVWNTVIELTKENKP